MNDFRIGGLVECIKSGLWVVVSKPRRVRVPQPRLGDRFTVADMDMHKGELYLFFTEFDSRHAFLAKNFRPVDPLFKTLDDIQEEVERDGVPLEEPEPVEA